jgi:hypothetical protein
MAAHRAADDLMTVGPYDEPRGAFLPSILY